MCSALLAPSCGAKYAWMLKETFLAPAATATSEVHGPPVLCTKMAADASDVYYTDDLGRDRMHNRHERATLQIVGDSVEIF